MALISVIIPVYNGERTIRETIESVLNQTFADFELIVINDGSKDTTLEIISSIQDPRLQVFSYSNAGQATSRNRGFSHATGNFIAFLDADDLWITNKLETQLKALQDNPQAAVAYSWSNCIDESGQFIRAASHRTVNGDVYAELLLTDFLDNGSNPLIRRQALTEVGGFNDLLPPAEDWDMWLRLAARYHFVAVPSPQVLYRQSTNSESSNVARLESACLRVIEGRFAETPNSLQHLKKPSIANLYKYLIFKCFEGYPERSRGLLGVRFLWNVIRNDPSFLRSRVLWKVLLKIGVMLLLPSQQAERFFIKFKKISNTVTLLGYMQLEA